MKRVAISLFAFIILLLGTYGCGTSNNEGNNIYKVGPYGRTISTPYADIVFKEGSFDRDVEIKVETVNVKNALVSGVNVVLLTNAVVLKKAFEIHFKYVVKDVNKVRIAELSPDSRWIVMKGLSVDNSKYAVLKAPGFGTYALFPENTEGLFVPPYLSYLSLSTKYIKVGTTAKLKFSLGFFYKPEPVQSCKLYIDGKYSKDVTQSGAFSISLEDYAKTVSFECENGVGRSSIASIVKPAVAPLLKFFAVSPPIIPFSGAPIKFVWGYKNQPIPEPECTVKGLGTGITYKNIKSGFLTHSNFLNLAYQLVCKNAAGESSLMFTVIPWTQNYMGSFNVTPAGGTYSFKNSFFSLSITIPPGEVTRPITFTIKPSTKYVPSGSLFTLPISIEPSFSFPNPITVMISYDPQIIKAFGIDDPSMISLGLGTSSGWRNVYSEVNTHSSIITAYLNHFSQYSVVPGMERKQPLKGNLTMLYSNDDFIYFHPYFQWANNYHMMIQFPWYNDPYYSIFSFDKTSPCMTLGNTPVDGVAGDFDGDGDLDFAVLCRDKDDSGDAGDEYYLEIFTSYWGPLHDGLRGFGGPYIKISLSGEPVHPLWGTPTQFRGAVLKKIHLKDENRDAVVIAFLRRYGISKKQYDEINQRYYIGFNCTDPDVHKRNPMCDTWIKQFDEDSKIIGSYSGVFVFGMNDGKIINLLKNGGYYKIDEIKTELTMDTGDADGDGVDEIAVAGLNGSSTVLDVLRYDESKKEIEKVDSDELSFVFNKGSFVTNMVGVGIGDFDDDGNMEIGLVSVSFSKNRWMELYNLKDNKLSRKKEFSFSEDGVFNEENEPDSYVVRSLTGDVSHDYVDDLSFGNKEKLVVVTFYRQKVAGKLEEAADNDFFETDLRNALMNDSLKEEYEKAEKNKWFQPNEGAFFTIVRKGGTGDLLVGGIKTFYGRIYVRPSENPCLKKGRAFKYVNLSAGYVYRRVYFPGDKLEQSSNGKTLTNTVSEWGGSGGLKDSVNVLDTGFDKNCNEYSIDINSFADEMQPIVIGGDYHHRATIIKYAGDYYHSESPPLPVVVMAPPPTYRVLTRNKSAGGLPLQSSGYSQYGEAIHNGEATSKTVGTKTGLTVSSDYEKSFKILSFGFGWSKTIEHELSSTIAGQAFITYGTERQGGSDTITVIYAVQRFISFKYWVLQHNNPEFNPTCDNDGKNCEYKHIYIDVPNGDPQVYTRSLDDYPGDKDVIRKIFREKPGFPETYMTKAEADALVDVDDPDSGDEGRYLGFESYEQTVGSGSGGYQSVYIKPGQEESFTSKEKISSESSWYLFFPGYSKHTHNKGVFTEKSYEVFQGRDVTYKGILGNVITGCFGSDGMPDPNGPCSGLDAYDYKWGMLVYNYVPNQGQGFFVIDYYVDSAPFRRWFYYDSGAYVETGKVGYWGEQYNKWVNEGTSGNVVYNVEACDYLNGNPANCGEKNAAGVIDLSYQFVSPFGGDKTYFVKRIAPYNFYFDSETANTLDIKYRIEGSSENIGRVVLGLVPPGNSFSDFVPLAILADGKLRNDANVPTTDTGWRVESFDLSQKGLNVGPFDRLVFYLDSSDSKGGVHTGEYHIYIDYMRLYDRNFPR